VWSSWPAHLNEGDGIIFQEQIEDTMAGFKVEWFRDGSGNTSTNFGTCTLTNYKKMATAGAITIISHGGIGEHLAVYAPPTPAGALACTNWIAGESGMTVKPAYNAGILEYYYVSVSTSWLEANWKPSLSNNNAIALWSTCYSAATPSTGSSVKEAAGGRWRIGYDLPTCEWEAMDVNEEFLGRMNGTISNGSLRTAGSAYKDPGVDYLRIYKRPWKLLPPYTPATTYEYDDNVPGVVDRTIGSVRMDGNYWTTLCPAPLEIAPVYPASAVTENRKGWGCILLDTALDNTPLATDAVVKESGGAVISDTHWLKDSEGNFYGIGFTFDKSADISPTTMKAISDKIRNKGTEGRQMDGNRVQPNADDKQWSF